MKSKIFLIFFLLIPFINCYTQDLKVSAKLDTNTVFIGDTLRLILSAEATNEWQPTFPDIPDNINGIEVRSKSAIDTFKSDNFFKLSQFVSLQPFDTGSITLHPFTFIYVNKSNGQQTLVTTDSLILTVNPYHSDTAKTIVDIKIPLEEPLTFWDYLPYIIGAILLIIAAYFAIRYFRKRKTQPQEQVDINLEKISYVWALDELAKLQKEQLWQNQKYKLHFTKLSEILRAYVEKKFYVPALEMTTLEIIENLKLKYIPSEYVSNLYEILKLSDLIKFAKHIPYDNECIDSFNNSIEFVKKTSTYKDLVEIINQEAE